MMTQNLWHLIQVDSLKWLFMSSHVPLGIDAGLV